MTRFRALFAALSLLVSLCAPKIVRADDAEAARAHFSAGVKLYDAHDYATALTEFQAAYAAKRSPQIKRNVALCLRGLGRYPEAIDALEEMLAEGGDTLKADVRDGAKQTIAEMSALVATVRVRVVYAGSTPPAAFAVSVDDKAVSAERVARPLRFLPGDHVFRAVATGFTQAEQRVHLTAGQPETSIELGLVAADVAGHGRLTIQASAPAAKIVLDGVEVGTGVWSGDVPAGVHRIEATIPGVAQKTVTVNVPPNAQGTVNVDLGASPAPEPFPAPKPPPAPRLWYVSAGVGVFGQALTPTALALDDTGTTKRNFGGASLVLHGGRMLGKNVSIGLMAELGGMSTNAYESAAVKGVAQDTITLTYVAVAPELRLRTTGKFRGFIGLALGLAAQGVDAKLGVKDASTQRAEKGSSGSGVALLEGGGQLDLGNFFVEGALFADVHGAGAVDGNGDRYFKESPVVRGGLRVILGYTL